MDRAWSEALESKVEGHARNGATTTEQGVLRLFGDTKDSKTQEGWIVDLPGLDLHYPLHLKIWKSGKKNSPLVFCVCEKSVFGIA